MDRSQMPTDESAEVPAVTPPPATPRPERDLDRALLHGLAWTGVARWTAQAATWLATIIVARLLTTHDFGIWTSAGVYLGVVTLLSEFGIGASVVMIRDLTGAQVAQVNGLALVTGVLGMMVSWILAWPLAWFYGAPQVALVICAMSVLFLIAGFRVVPLALLQKDLQFKKLAFIDAARVLTQAAVLVVSAAAGLKYWTLVAGAFAGESAWTLMILACRRNAFAWPRRSSIQHAMSFSRDLVLARLSWYLYSNSDFLVAGRRLGQAAQGAYGLAWNLASVPVEKVSSIIVSVTPAFFSAVQSDAAQLRRYLLNLTQGISLLAFPAGVGIALVADSFVTTVLGVRWKPAVAPLQLLALYTTVRSIGPILTQVLNAIGETRYSALNNVAALVLMPVAFVTGSHWGTTGVAAGWLIGHPIILGSLFWRVATRIHLRLADYARALWPAMSACLAMVVAVVTIRAMLPESTAPAVGLVAEILAGAATYAALLFFFHRSRIDALRRALRVARGR